jgi:hypothetical protein
MDSNHIHIFLEKILSTARCPECNRRVYINDITIQNIDENICLFRINCAHCGLETMAQAVLSIVPKEKSKNAKPVHTLKNSISKDEIKIIHDDFMNKKHKNLSSFFSK